MTAAQLAKRLGVSQPRVTVLEKDEVKRKLTLQTLEKTAVALNCTLVYALVPNSSLEKMVQERAEKIAESRLKTVGHSMNLEGQSVSADDENVHRRELIEKIILRESRHLWEQL
jgi:predicted DNA-binding mobile mystery protein A